MSPLVTWGLFGAWVLHDVEELLTMPDWGRRNIPRLRRRYPRIPERLWRMLDLSPAQVYTAIGLMGAVIFAAAADGARTDGRSSFFQVVLAGFGLHSLAHLGQSALVRGYTPGVVTAPVVVAPFGLWAWHRLDQAGALGAAGDTADALLLGLAGFALLVPALQGGAWLLVRAGRRLRSGVRAE
jgi:Protein of unknown function with HXXEE motif